MSGPAHVVVATIVQREGRFPGGGRMFHQHGDELVALVQALAEEVHGVPAPAIQDRMRP